MDFSIRGRKRRKRPEKDEPIDLPIASTPLGVDHVRIVTIVEQEGYVFVKDLMKATREDMEAIPYLGRDAVNLIKRVLSGIGVKLPWKNPSRRRRRKKKEQRHVGNKTAICKKAAR